uniref:Uncharacterized protein n=1 Tax=Oryza nivara TaxID=4536 RepID=A0A0E0GAY9_ORYNI
MVIHQHLSAEREAVDDELRDPRSSGGGDEEDVGSRGCSAQATMEESELAAMRSEAATRLIRVGCVALEVPLEPRRRNTSRPPPRSEAVAT